MGGADLEARLEAILRASGRLMTVLETVRELDLPDWRIVSGAVYQTVWNFLTGRHPDHGIRDYDTVYFDADTSWDAEDVWIKRAAAAFPPSLSQMVEVRNQARVHLWFEAKFGEAYPPLSCTDESLERFVCPAFAIGVRLEADGRLDIAAPFGLQDCFDMRLRSNPRLQKNMANYHRAIVGLQARWPEITVEAMQAP